MTNKQLQQRTEQIIKSLGTTHEWMQGKVDNPFPIGRKYAYNLSRGLFDKCGKHGIAAMKEYFNKIDKTNEDAKQIN